MHKAVKVTVVTVGVLAVVFCVASYAADRALLGQTYARIEPRPTSLLLTDADVAEDYPMRDVEFQLDSYTLRGKVYGEGDDRRGLIVLRHGIYSQHQDYLAFITTLVDGGWKVFAYDAIGCGESDGDSVLGFAQSPRDVHAAVQFARESGMADGLPVALFGHSWGGYGVAGALDYGDDVFACVSLSGFDEPNGIIFESAEASMGAVAITQRPFINFIGLQDFGEDANRSASRAIAESGIPTLVVHGTGDAVIAYDGASIMAQRDAMRANDRVRYVTVDEPGRNGHNDYFYSRESQAYLAQVTAQLQALTDETGGELSQDELAAFMEGVDKRRANTADPELMTTIENFLDENLPSK